MNYEGYTDKTAENAIYNAGHIPAQIRNVLGLLNNIAGLAGFEIEEIKIRDRISKKTYQDRKDKEFR